MYRDKEDEELIIKYCCRKYFRKDNSYNWIYKTPGSYNYFIDFYESNYVSSFLSTFTKLVIPGDYKVLKPRLRACLLLGEGIKPYTFYRFDLISCYYHDIINKGRVDEDIFNILKDMSFPREWAEEFKEKIVDNFEKYKDVILDKDWECIKC